MTGNLRPSISFLLPTYNRLPLFKSALASVFEQEELNTIDYEILVGDDSSNDETKNYIEGLENEDSKVVYLRNTEKGQFPNLNNLISKASKDWIVFLHDDDCLGKLYLKEIFDSISVNSDTDIIWTGRYLVSRDGGVISVQSGKKDVLGSVKVDSKKYFYNMLSKHDYLCGGVLTYPMVTGLCVRAKLAKKVKFKPVYKVNADSLFLWTVFFESKSSVFVNKPIVSYLVVEDSERAKPSESGIIYDEMKGITDELLSYIEPQLSQTDFHAAKKSFYENFYRNAILVNSPLMWTALRYKGNYLRRLKIQFRIISQALVNYPQAILNPISVFSIVVSFFPQPLLKLLYRVFLRIN